MFEGVEINLYSFIRIEVKDKVSGNRRTVSTYILDNFNPELLNERTHFFERYSSINGIFGEYKKEEDNIDDSDKLLKQVKKQRFESKNDL